MSEEKSMSEDSGVSEEKNMSEDKGVSEEKALKFWNKTWFRWVAAIVLILALMAVSVIIWRRPIVNAISRKKAQELHDLATAKGFKVPSVETLANIYGTDGGATAATADSDIARALLAMNINRSGEVNQRSSIIDRRLLEFEYLVLTVYRPGEAAKFKAYYEGLKNGETLTK
ncbi:MAG: hypothetical protein ACYC99_12400 [Candidatus Geothermincolia bacterium]